MGNYVGVKKDTNDLYISIDCQNIKCYNSGSLDVYNLGDGDVTGSLKGDISLASNNNLELNDELSHIRFPYGSFNPSEYDFTIEMWLTPTGVGSRYIVHLSNNASDPAGAGNYTLSHSSTQFAVSFNFGTFNSSSFTEHSNKPTHLVHTLNHTTSTSDLYINGELAHSVTPLPSTPSNKPYAFGVGSRMTTFNGFLGELPYVQIYKKHMTAVEVQSNFNQSKHRFGIG